MKQAPDDKYSFDQAQQRLKKILKAAFGGSPTLLKDIPTRWGEQRAQRDGQSPRPRRRRQRKNRAA
jgi:hypothetical protein